MPIEIKELIIKASVRDDSETTAENGMAAGAPHQGDDHRDERIVAQCVEQVMDILRIQNER